MTSKTLNSRVKMESNAHLPSWIGHFEFTNILGTFHNQQFFKYGSKLQMGRIFKFRHTVHIISNLGNNQFTSMKGIAMHIRHLKSIILSLQLSTNIYFIIIELENTQSIISWNECQYLHAIMDTPFWMFKFRRMLIIQRSRKHPVSSFKANSNTHQSPFVHHFEFSNFIETFVISNIKNTQFTIWSE